MAQPYQIGEFVLESKLGEGGMGVVFRARQVALDRWVALKLLSRPVTTGSTFIERFHREARAAARLVHPNIIQIYTIGEHKGTPFFAMEYVEGRDLASILRSGEPLSLDESVEIIRSVAKALGMAAEHGIVHRDIKPANIMIARSGLIKVMDFGLAKPVTAETELTHDGQIMGTPTYMSPEQGMSKDVDTRSDFYSLGCVFYECLTGHPPYRADNVASLIFKHLYEPIESPKIHNASLPEALEAVALKLLAKKPEDRYANAGDLLTALATIPTNTLMAEISLAKRAKQAEPEAASPEASNSDAASSEGTPTVVRAPTPSDQKVHPTPTSEALLVVRDEFVRAADVTPAPVPKRPTSVRAPDQTEGPFRVKSSRMKPPEAPARPTSSSVHLAVPSEIPPARPASSSAHLAVSSDVPPVHQATSPTPAFSPAVTSSRRMAAKASVSPYFKKLTDSRWSYDITQGHCKHAEGLAAETLPGVDLAVGSLGDCLVCSNWTRRSGCAIATTQQLAATSRAKGADLLEELAAVWCQAGRFEKAVELMEAHIKANPEEPGGYRALARLYERPDYPGKDRMRAVVLYNRFVELAQAQTGYSPLELQRARERLEAIKAGRASAGHEAANRFPSGAFMSALHTFRCFYRVDSFAYFAFGALSRDRLVVARAGEVDPESGMTAAEVGNPLQRATSIFRRMKSERAKLDEREEVKKEIDRLERTPLEALARESGRSLSFPLQSFQSIDYIVDNATEIRTVRFRTPSQRHELIFPSQSGLDAERCAVLAKRITGK